MKNLKLLFITILIAACSSRKNSVPNTSYEKKNIITVKDSAVVDTIPDSINVSNEEIIQSQEVLTEEKTTEKFNHSDWNLLLQKHVSNKGNVNYKTFKSNRNQLLNYITILSENIPTENWTKEEKLAYWINAYNALTIDLILRNYPIKSIKDIKDPWDQRLWKLGEKWYNLNEIEHQILRKMDEPRIHFAIVCASVSCPKLSNEAYTAENLEAQLTKATKDFLSDSDRNIISENSIEISKIFQWFAKDFKQSGDIIDFLNQYSDIKISEKAKKSYKDYNWDLNE